MFPKIQEGSKCTSSNYDMPMKNGEKISSSWLVHSENKNCVMCFCCLLFGWMYNIYSIYKENILDIYPNLSIALRLLALPVTVSSGERSFSSLRLIKTYLRSTCHRSDCLHLLFSPSSGKSRSRWTSKLWTSLLCEDGRREDVTSTAGFS